MTILPDKSLNKIAIFAKYARAYLRKGHHASELTDMHFNGFITSTACVHKIMEHADDVSKWDCFAEIS